MPSPLKFRIKSFQVNGKIEKYNKRENQPMHKQFETEKKRERELWFRPCSAKHESQNLSTYQIKLLETLTSAYYLFPVNAQYYSNPYELTPTIYIVRHIYMQR